MGWWTLKLDTSQSRRVADTLHSLQDRLQGEAVDQFLRDLSAEDGPICAFFRDMFAARGEGGSWYGQTWKPLDPDYLKDKKKKFGREEIGVRTTELLKSLTTDSPFAIRRVSGGVLTFGSRVQDTASSKGRNYAGYFNQDRPVIDRQMLNDLTDYMTRGPGKAAFDALAATLKARLLEGTK